MSLLCNHALLASAGVARGGDRQVDCHVILSFRQAIQEKRES
jgi:hypothetical protein